LWIVVRGEELSLRKLTVAAMDSKEDSPNIVSGEIITSETGEHGYKVIKKIGTGRCCVVYSGSDVQDGSMVALKFFRRGSNYEGAVQRERYILERFNEPEHNLVACYAYLTYRGMHCLVLELLDVNIRQVIFKNDRRGLSPWVTIKYARDVLTALKCLHQAGIVHADLKPANILWCSQEGVFKCIDFGLAFSTKEEDVHQIQSEGYRAPEAKDWNKWKDNQNQSRRRKLQGSFSHISGNRQLHREFLDDDRKHPSDTDSGKMTATEAACVDDDRHVKLDLSTDQDCEEVFLTHDESNACVKPASDKKPIHNSLHHSDSHSSGIFSQESSDRSQCSSRLSCDGEAETRAKTNKVIDSGHAVFNDENLQYLEEVTKKVEDKVVQDWRRSNRHSAIYDDRPKSPETPSTSSDIWSLGCLIAEALTGRKLFQTGDKMASVLRPAQLLEMKLGGTEVAWTKKGHKEMFSQIKELILMCISRDPITRINADEALNHPVFSQKPGPSMKDLYLLQSPRLQFSQFSNTDSNEPNKVCEEMLKDLRVECEAYGEITECKVAKGGHAFVHFQEEVWVIL